MIGQEWLLDLIDGLTTKIETLSPSEFAERHRILPASVSPFPGPMSFDVNPFMREIVDCADESSPVREWTLLKGVQITATTALEVILFYALAYQRTIPIQLITADDGLAKLRMEAHVLPMFHESGFAGIFQSADIRNKRKTGTTQKLLQVLGGGYLIVSGAMSPRNFRSMPILLSVQDELDAWPVTIGTDGNTSKLADDRTTAYHDQRKIFRNSTPLVTSSSAIYRHYLRGDQRQYMVRCLGCDFSQALVFGKENERGEKYGLKWDSDQDGRVATGTVRYHCIECGHPHQDHDKERLYSPDNGAEWVPTARPVAQGIRSYHLPGLYSPAGFKSWESCVIDYMDAYDPVGNRIRDLGLYRTFYNNVLGWPFDNPGSWVSENKVLGHKRNEYFYGQVPNKFAVSATGGPILLLTLQVDVHKRNLAVAVIGWTRDARNFLINYWRIEDEDCTSEESPAWGRVKEIITDSRWMADDGQEYNIDFALIDAGYFPDTVASFCSQFEGVYPIIGRDRAAKAQSIQEFAEFEMRKGLKGYRVLVDHYKDRIAPVLRREWTPGDTAQPRYHFNAPQDITKKQLKELTVEKLEESTGNDGKTVFKWVRPGNVPNELWDLLVYGHAAIDILAWAICRGYYQLETVNWDVFWAHFEQSRAN